MAQLRKLHLFNCDRTYKLDAVEGLLVAMKAKLGFDSVKKHYFSLNEMPEMTHNTIPKLEMDMAFFVVHAHESRLSINEENAGIGYAKIYRALLEATEGKVIILIGGDDNYQSEDEEDRLVISRWARRKISSQFKTECLDGSKSFIFSWNKKHRDIHEEALLHFFDASKKGQKFEYQPKPKQPVVVQSAKTNETSEHSDFSDHSNNAKPKEDSHSDSRNTGKGGEGSSSSDSREAEQSCKVDLTEPPKPPWICPSNPRTDLAILCCNVTEDSTDAVMNVFHDIAPKLNLSATPVFENLSPDKIKRYLMKLKIKACILVVDGKTVKDAYKNLTEQKEEYRGLLETAVEKVEKVVVLICGNYSLPPKDEEIVIRAIKAELVLRRKKGFIAWLKNERLSVDPVDLAEYLMFTSPTPQPNTQTNALRASQDANRDVPGSGAESYSTYSGQSQSGPLQRNPSDLGHMQQPTDPAPPTIEPLMNTCPVVRRITGEPVWLRSILRNGIISFELKDLQLWEPTFIVPEFINQELLQRYRHTPEIGVRIVQGNDGQLHWSVDPKLIEVSRLRNEGIKKIDANDTLVLKTRIRNGLVSFQENDVDFRHGNFRIPQEIINKLKNEHSTTPCGELYIISDKTGNLRSIVNIKNFGRLRTILNK